MVPPNRLIQAFVVIVLTGTAFALMLVSISASTADEWSEYLANGTGLAVICWALILVASARVDGIGHEMKIVNFFMAVTVPAPMVRGAEAENGLSIVLDDEVRVECVAYGSSLLQVFIPRLRPDRYIGSVVEWACRHGGGPGARVVTGLDVRRSVRTYVWLGLPALWLGAMAYMTVVRAAADPLRALLRVSV